MSNTLDVTLQLRSLRFQPATPRGKRSKRTDLFLVVPNEIVEFIIEEGISDNNRDLLSLGLTSKRMHFLVSRIMAKNIRCVFNKDTTNSKFASLLALVDSENGRGRVKTLQLSKVNWTPLRPRFIPQLLTVLAPMSSLSHLSLAADFISNDLLSTLYHHATIKSLEITRLNGDRVYNQRLDELPRPRAGAGRPPRPSGPLILSNFVATAEGSNQLLYLQAIPSFIDSLPSYGTELPSVELVVESAGQEDRRVDRAALQASGPLVRTLFPSLDLITLVITPGSTFTAYALLSKIARVQRPSRIVVVVRAAQQSASTFPGFLGPFLPLWTPMEDITTALDKDASTKWRDVLVTEVRGSYVRGRVLLFVLASLSIVLDPEESLSSDQIKALTNDRIVKGVRSLEISSGRFRNFLHTMNIFPGFKHLTSLTLINMDLTALPTITTTLACSSACFHKLERSHPHFHQSAQLVGGYQKLRQLLIEINVLRFEQLLLTFPDPKFQGRYSVEGAVEAWSVIVPNSNKEDGGRTWKLEVNMVESMKGGKKPRCYGCEQSKASGKRRGGSDHPIVGLMSCELGEVSNALRSVGVDFEDVRARIKAQQPSLFGKFLLGVSYIEEDGKKLQLPKEEGRGGGGTTKGRTASTTGLEFM